MKERSVAVKLWLLGMAVAASVAAYGCGPHVVEGGEKPILVEIKPIHITMDINVRLQIADDLADIFGPEGRHP